MNTDTLEVLARMSGTQIEVREIVNKYLLITYDLPHNDEGDKARRQFIEQAKMIGAVRHTDSVYVLPHTQFAEHLALELARKGDVVVWTSVATNPDQAKEITRTYDKGLEPMMDEIGERLDKMVGHLNAGHQKRAIKMLDKTERMMNALEQAIVRRGSAQLYIMFELLRRRFKQVQI